MSSEMDTVGTGTLCAGEVLEISGPQLSSGQVWKSANAYIASVLQTGKVIGNGPGETELWVEEDRRPIRKIRCIVRDGKCLLPILLNRYNGVPGPAGRLIPLVQEYIPENSVLRGKPLLVEEHAAAAFLRMYAAAREQDVWLLATEGHRTLEYQEQMIREAMETESEERVMSRFAPPGFSEHHSGLALDIRGGVFQNGEPQRNNKVAWKWLAKHCYEFGFMIKNPPGKENITGTIYEPWHIRYLGNLELCRYLHEHRLVLDEYLDQHGADASANGFMFFGEKDIQNAQLSKDEYEHVRVAALDGEETIDAALERMTFSRDKYGVPFKYYRRAQLYKFSEKSIIGRGEMLQKMDEDNERYYEEVCASTERTVEQIRQDLAVFNDNPYAKVNIAQYCQLGLYRTDPDTVKNILIDLRDRASLQKKLVSALEIIDHGNGDYASISVDLERYYQVTERTLLPSDVEDKKALLEKTYPGIMENESASRKIVVDILVCERLLGFLDWEYALFELKDKSFALRRTYISNNFRMQKVGKVNNKRKGEIFDNKFQTYEVFKEFFGREVIAINSDDDFEQFFDFCKRHPCFVKKPINGTMGSGVGLVNASADEDLRALFTSLREEMGTFMCEERIISHPDIQKLNADSVNTVRMTTYHDGQKTHILWPWQKIGRSGLFVDNAGTGGLIVAIDINTGRLMPDGVDEIGHHYKVHPDNGLELNGYQLPDWEGALAFGKAISEYLVANVDGIRFVGWDIAYTKDNRWVIIEGNTFPQIVQQATYGKGFRAELDQLIPG